jgi:DNA-binding NtrC family response regulator
MALILVANKNFEDLLFQKEFLLGLGHELRLAASCDMISELINAESFEVFILSFDMLMNDNSIQLLHEIDAQDSESKVILLASESAAETLPPEVASRYFVLSKPLDLDKLKEILGAVA